MFECGKGISMPEAFFGIPLLKPSVEKSGCKRISSPHPVNNLHLILSIPEDFPILVSDGSPVIPPDGEVFPQGDSDDLKFVSLG